MKGATAATLKRLEELSRQRATTPPGVLAVPPILPLDEWEARAVASQQRLEEQTHEGVTTR